MSPIPGRPAWRIAWHRSSGALLFRQCGQGHTVDSPKGRESKLSRRRCAASRIRCRDRDVAASFTGWTITRRNRQRFIRRANLDGTGVEPVVTTAAGLALRLTFSCDGPRGLHLLGVLEGGLPPPRRPSVAQISPAVLDQHSASRQRPALAIRHRSQYCHRVLERPANRAIFRRPITGTFNETGSPQHLVLNAPHGIGLDLDAQKSTGRHWPRNNGPTETSARRVARCNFDGTEFEALTASTGANEPWDPRSIS